MQEVVMVSGRVVLIRFQPDSRQNKLDISLAFNTAKVL
jgi:hypothetical protein